MTTLIDQVDQVINEYFAERPIEGNVDAIVFVPILNQKIGGDIKNRVKLPRFIDLAEAAGWKIVGSVVVNQKLNPVERIILSGREKLERMQAEKAEKDARLDALRAAQLKNDGEKILSLVPAELHEYVSHDHIYIYINLPYAAQLATEYRVTTERVEINGLSDLFIAEIWLKENAVNGKVWSLWQYKAYEGDVGLFPCGDGEFYKDLDVALARAFELGDGKVAAELDAEHQRAEYENWKAINVVTTEEEMPICPLMSQGEQYERCVGAKCAWFVAWEGMYACSLKVLANKAADGMEVG